MRLYKDQAVWQTDLDVAHKGLFFLILLYLASSI